MSFNVTTILGLNIINDQEMLQMLSSFVAWLACLFMNDLIPCNCMWTCAFMKWNNFMMNETKNSQHFHSPNCCL